LIAGIFLGQSALKEGNDYIEPFLVPFGVIAFGVGANIMYTLGPAIEHFFITDTDKREKYRAFFFRAGLAFSCLLATAPFWDGLAFYILRPEWAVGVIPN